MAEPALLVLLLAGFGTGLLGALLGLGGGVFLVPLLTLRRFQQAGHRPIVLAGGATGLIGDPSGRASERVLNTPDRVRELVEKLRPQLAKFVDFEDSLGKPAAEAGLRSGDMIVGVNGQPVAYRGQLQFRLLGAVSGDGRPA